MKKRRESKIGKIFFSLLEDKEEERLAKSKRKAVEGRRQSRRRQREMLFRGYGQSQKKVMEW